MPSPADFSHRWWFSESRSLVSSYAKTVGLEGRSALYVYNLDVVRSRCRQLRESLGSLIGRFFYAIKANCNTNVLEIVFNEGFGFECVSIEEVEFVVRTFSGRDESIAKRILFTPNFAARAEYEAALQFGVQVTVDNSYCLEHWPQIFEDKELFLRIDPGELSDGHHKKVQTAGKAAKFGIPIADLAAIALPRGSSVIGLHAHVGSGILTHYDAWMKTASALRPLLEIFPTVKHIDIGGGLGVPYHFEESPLNLEQVSAHLKPICESIPNVQFWLEPGRFIVCESGVLLAQVTQLKSKGDHCYVGINAGMNALIRPALYDAYHEITNISHLVRHGFVDAESLRRGLLSEEFITADVVGPICETGDVLGVNRLFPKDTVEDDIVVIDCAGAYGFSMVCNYNKRPPGVEITVGNEDGSN